MIRKAESASPLLVEAGMAGLQKDRVSQVRGPSGHRFLQIGSLRSALAILLKAATYADDVGSGLWEFAVGWETFRDQQVASNDLRWLLRKGYVVGKYETTRPNSTRRRFHSMPIRRYDASACYVLSPCGLDFARLFLSGNCEVAPPRSTLLGNPWGQKPNP
jgi:hypothetical protein